MNLLITGGAGFVEKLEARKMNNKETKKLSLEFELPDWKRVRIPGLLESAYEACLTKKFPLGLLLNFNEVLVKHGIHRILNVPRSLGEVLH